MARKAKKKGLVKAVALGTALAFSSISFNPLIERKARAEEVYGPNGKEEIVYGPQEENEENERKTNIEQSIPLNETDRKIARMLEEKNKEVGRMIRNIDNEEDAIISLNAYMEGLNSTRKHVGMKDEVFIDALVALASASGMYGVVADFLDENGFSEAAKRLRKKDNSRKSKKKVKMNKEERAKLWRRGVDGIIKEALEGLKELHSQKKKAYLMDSVMATIKRLLDDGAITKEVFINSLKKLASDSKMYGVVADFLDENGFSEAAEALREQ
ncbi:MAG: hypothetical protein D6769_01625 [Methanobacteriota archaeon]|nr:MAG: hypothetical protein D6769_01625 [Euryarchaeota archaeon]